MKNSNSSNNSIKMYLDKKYQQAFTFVSQGDDVWSAKTKTEVYTDQSGNKFTVKYRDGYCTDNYCSIIFDKDIEQIFQSAVNANCKVFVSTKSSFFGETDVFNNTDDYMKQCPVINISVIVLRETDFSSISTVMLNAGRDFTASVMIYCVTPDLFNDASAYSDGLDQTKIISTGSFWIENNTITSESWEA